MKGRLLLGAILLSGLLQAAPVAAQDFSYDGKLVNLVVPYPPGGGTTVTGQFFARWLQRHLDGNPSVQVVNIEGASGVIGSNEYALRYPHDGYGLLLGSTALFLVKEKGVEFDPNDFEAVASIPAGNVAYVRSDTGIKSPADLATLKEPLFFAASRPSGGDLIRAFALDLLDVPIKINYGYDGRGAARVAFEQGESSIDIQTTPTYINSIVPLVNDGVAVPLFSLGLIVNGEIARDPAFPDLPHVGEVYEAIHGRPPSGPAWDAYKFMIAAGVNGAKVIWVHKDAPAGALEKLRAAAAAMAADPQLASEGASELGGYQINFGEELKKTVAVALNPSQETRDVVAKFILEQNQ